MTERSAKTEAKKHTQDRINRGKRTYIAALGRLTGNALREQDRTGRTPKHLHLLDRALSPKTKLPPLSPDAYRQIAKVMEQTMFWHGTGRYQYRDGKVIDVLDYIATHRKLQPGPDPFEVSGPMHSLSLARARIYARAYADLHRNPDMPAERYGTSAFWSVVFLADYAVEAASEEGGLKRVIKRLQQSGKDEWHAKVNQQPLSVFSTFAVGSDIPGNYPIIFGVSSITPLPTSHAIALHEIRSGDPVQLDSQITHLEVPHAHITETNEVLSRHAIILPVYALEDFERYAATLPISRLMNHSTKS